MKTITLDFPEMSLLDVREKFKDCFFGQSWYDKEPFATEKIPAGRWEVSLRELEGSLGKTWNEQQSLPHGIEEEIPPVAVLVYAMCQHFKDTGERVFEKTYVRTSRCDRDSSRVSVGDFDSEGLCVNSDWDNDRNDILGVSAARKLDTRNDTLESLNARLLELEAWKNKVCGV